ncbi:hypothetical protein FRC02_011050 [Tulasnella sp. 418]|nr:hypothetical protein FRC02_011050 [Tulasnella sp. 418]
MSKHEVDQIPQVIYIPPPPSSDPAEPASSSPEYPPKPHAPVSGAEASAEPATGEAVQSERTVGNRIKNAFKIFQRKRPVEKTDIEAAPKRISEDHSSEDPWEAQFEKGAYPFIRLEQHRDVCAICLVNYVPPRRRDANLVSGAMTSTNSTNNEHPETTDNNNDEENEEEEQTGKPGEPLRHLPCGHVFHTEPIHVYSFFRPAASMNGSLTRPDAALLAKEKLKRNFRLRDYVRGDLSAVTPSVKFTTPCTGIASS